jgi:hypothetical protein
VAAVDRVENAPPFVNLDAALDAAPEIQFLEQIFEWDKLTYVLYPYYWAPSSEWDELQPIEGADPEYARFLRAGSARVVVAARPGYACAVNHWLWFGRPWGGDTAPTPGQEGYVSIADEIRALNQAPDDGEPQESWEVRLPTTLIWLDPDPSLPKYNLSLRLDEPANPGERLCSPADSAPDGRDTGNYRALPRSSPTENPRASEPDFVPADDNERELLRAARAGTPSAAFTLGLRLRDRGEAEAAQYWTLQAAEGGDIAAAYTLSLVLRQQGEEQAADEWLLMAAQGGDAAAAATLGSTLADRGQREEALRWLQLAAKQGDPGAQGRLAELSGEPKPANQEP